ncbi:MAG TPA: hypothetical protein VFE62_22880 [Gemmataceae bacterium]|nr:hypothetical protein [Gemmataceae bacterium]
MVDKARALVEKQIERVRRRLLLQIGIDSIILSLALGLLLATVWFVVRPFAFPGAGSEFFWGVPAGLLAISILAGAGLAWTRRPSRVASSLALDEKFGLKERVTTFLTLPSDQLDSPVGKALLRDVTEHLGNLKVTSEFPIRIPVKKLAVPGVALALALIACVIDPVLSDLKLGSSLSADEPKKVYDVTKAQDELDKIKKAILQRNNDEKLPKSEELKELEREFEKLVKDPIENKSEEKMRERVNQMRDLSDRMKERMEGLKEKTEKTDALKKQLEKLGLLDKENGLKEGAAKDLEDALMKGDFNKAKQALDKLAQELKNEKLDEAAQQNLAEQMKKLGDRLNKLMEKDDLRQQLKKDLEDKKINKEDFDRAMERFQDLQNLADKLGDAQEALEKGKGKEAGKKLDELAKELGENELTEQEIGDLLRDQGEIDEATRLMMAAMAREDMGDDEGDGNGEGNRPGGRRRANPNDPNSKIRDERTRAQVDAKGTQRITGYARGGTFNKVSARDVGNALKRAAQDGPEALDRQRIPEDAADITRGYFRQLGNQK